MAILPGGLREKPLPVSAAGHRHTLGAAIYPSVIEKVPAAAKHDEALAARKFASYRLRCHSALEW
jgi:hypothetical protein